MSLGTKYDKIAYFSHFFQIFTNIERSRNLLTSYLNYLTLGASQARPQKDIATRAMTPIEFGYKRSKLRSRMHSFWRLSDAQHPDNQPGSQWIDHRSCLQKKGMWILSALKLGTACSGGEV